MCVKKSDWCMVLFMEWEKLWRVTYVEVVLWFVCQKNPPVSDASFPS